MKRTPVRVDPASLPAPFRPLLEGCNLFDSSCSREARVYFLDRDGGLFLKTAPKGTLAQEAVMTAYFFRKGFGPEILSYESGDRDWLLTRRIPGEDCTSGRYLEDPGRLCDTLAAALRQLHETKAPDCPMTLTAERLARAEEQYRADTFGLSLFRRSPGFDSPEEAIARIRAQAHLLRSDVLIHGDCCLPNVMLDGWKFTGFIDVGGGGLGDRHFDLFWGLWSLGFNLKTDRYAARFLDAYGRDAVEPELLRTVAAIEAFG